MDGKVIDARGLACPHPVMETQKALRQLGDGILVTIVDNEAARDNITRLGSNLGCEVSIEPKEDGIYLTLRR